MKLSSWLQRDKIVSNFREVSGLYRYFSVHRSILRNAHPFGRDVFLVAQTVEFSSDYG